MAKATTKKPAAKKKAAKKPILKKPVPKKPAPKKPAAQKPLAKKPPSKKLPSKKPLPKPRDGQPVLLSGGNPQIAKADGDAPVQAYIAAMPGWKSGVGRNLDALITRTVPGVKKAVRWNSPFYGLEGKGWFLSWHCFAKYVKLAFFKGAALHPVPPGPSKDQHVRYLDIHENDVLDEQILASWIRQAAALPGWIP